MIAAESISMLFTLSFINFAVKSFESFLGEYVVYNSVDTFDSLCAHFKVLDPLGGKT